MPQTPSLSILRQLIEGTDSIPSRTAVPGPAATPVAAPTEVAVPEPPPSAPDVPIVKTEAVKLEEKTIKPEAPLAPATVTPPVEPPAPQPKAAVASAPASAPAPRQAPVQSNSFLKVLAENAPVAMAIFDSDMKYLYANHRWLEFFKLEQTEVVGRSQYEVFPSLHPGWRHVYERAQSGQVVRSDRDTVNQAGRPVLYRWEVRPWRKDDTSVGGVMITCLSIPGVQSRDVADNATPAAPVAATDTSPALWDLALPWWRWMRKVMPAAGVRLRGLWFRRER